MSKNKIKNEKAITLIALIVTIIVLLILAGVSIAVLTGDNSILRRSSEAKITTKIAEIEEQANLIYTGELITKLKAPTGDRDVELAVVCDKLQDEYGEEKIQFNSTEAPQVKSVIINQTELSIMQGETGTVTATVVPKATSGGAWYAVVEGKYYKIDIPEGKKQIKIERTETPNVTGGDLPTATFTSNNAKVTVEGGTVTVDGEATGTAIITASAGGVAATNECTVTVLSEIGSISVAPTSKTLGTGETAQIGTTNTADIIVTPNASVASTVAEPVTYSYSSAEPTKVSVNNSGVISGEAVTTGSVNVTITATGTISGTTTDSVTVAVTVTQVVGKFQTVVTNSPNQGDGVAYYYTGTTPTSGTAIDANNMGQFLGKKVTYVADPSTSSSRFSDRATETTYRIFYIDVTGKYGDGAGTIYLKQDCDEHNVIIASDKPNLTTLYDGLDSSNKMAQLNPDWASEDNDIGDSAEKAVSYLCNTTIWQYYKDAVGTNQIARYVVGAPSIEMWVDSYNAFIDYNADKGLVKSTVAKNNNWSGKLETEYNTERERGYKIGIVGDNYTTGSSNGSGYTAVDSLMTPGGQTNSELSDRVKMYNESTSSKYWLASPSSDTTSLAIVEGNDRRVIDFNYNNTYAFCPLVSCNSGVAITEAQ